MVSFTSLSLLALSALSALFAVQAAPLTERDVPISVCKTIAKGNLRTTNGHTFQFGEPEGVLKFGGELAVEFQSCQPNFSGYDGNDGRPVGGHIYIPSTNKCLSADLEDGTTSPFQFSQAECYTSDDSGQINETFIKQSDGKIYWNGVHQAGKPGPTSCKSGLYGVSSSITEGPVQFFCVDKGHIVGLNI